jgi:site-specific recombinase XerD/DNA-binding XRE family transcriptional regulator
MTARPRTLAACVEPFLFWLGGVRGRRPQTLTSYRGDLHGFTTFCREAGVEDPGAVQYQHVEFYLGWLQESGLSAGTAVRHLATLRSFFRYLVRERIVTQDPAAVAFGPKTPRRLPIYLTIPEQERVLATLARDRTRKGCRDYAAVATLLLTGLRADELLNLELGHLSLEGRTLRVVNGKGGKDRELPVVDRLATILGAYLTDVRPDLSQARVSPFVFLPLDARGRGGVRGGQLERQWLWRLVAHRVGAIVGRKVYPHALRHSFASRLREGGGDLALIQETLGHSELSTTMIYAHLPSPMQRAALARLLGDPAAPGPVPPRPATVARRGDARRGAYVALGDRIRLVRDRLGLHQADLAARLQVGRTTLLRAERGAGRPRRPMLERLAGLGGVTVDWLLRGDATTSRQEDAP